MERPKVLQSAAPSALSQPFVTAEAAGGDDVVPPSNKSLHHKKNVS